MNVTDYLMIGSVWWITDSKHKKAAEIFILQELIDTFYETKNSFMQLNLQRH